MAEISTIMENFQKGFQSLTDKLNQYPDAAASKKVNENITKLITDTASLIAFPVATIMKKVHDYTLEKLNEKQINKLSLYSQVSMEEINHYLPICQLLDYLYLSLIHKKDNEQMKKLKLKVYKFISNNL